MRKSELRFMMLILCLVSVSMDMTAQGVQKSDSDSIVWEASIREVVVESRLSDPRDVSIKGAAASIDEHLSNLSGVSMIRRGSYAWEPVVNNMATERLSTTIDGMKIFYACTDKMDPVTSYVESNNLQRISLNSGLEGNPQSTGNIGGSIDLRLRRVGFDSTPSEYTLTTGLEGNGLLQVYGADAAFSLKKWYTNFGLFYRHADDYKAGGNEKVNFSQFQKANVFVNMGYKPVAGRVLEATFIYDGAHNVGYPALGMDVKLAEAYIGSLSYNRVWNFGFFRNFETKVYYNHITHDMDDTHRPNVEVHMDMPGRSSTAGLYSLWSGSKGKHSYKVNYDFYYNRLYADMMMYPESSSPMFMLTWPDVRTANMGLSLSDDIFLSAFQTLRLSVKESWQYRLIHNKEGLDALKVYFPDMPKSFTGFEGRWSMRYTFSPGYWKISVGAGVGNRIPTVTEGCGYFLYNTYDHYDYIGNPALKDEQVVENSLSVGWKDRVLAVTADADAFFFNNYIIGQPDDRLSPMSYGASGVKVYRNLSSARIFNLSLTAEYSPFGCMTFSNILRYGYGKECTGSSLPLIAPLSDTGRLRFFLRKWVAEVGVLLSTPNSRYSYK